MNRQITRIALARARRCSSRSSSATTYWQTWAARGPRRPAGQRDPARRAVHDQARARSSARRPRPSGHERASGRSRARRSSSARYPNGGLVAQTVGYSTQVALADRPRAVPERLPDRREQEPQHRPPAVRSTSCEGMTITGNDVVLTLRPGAQQLAQNLLGRKCGAVVALDPRTGRVLVIASQPDLQPEPGRDATSGRSSGSAPTARPAGAAPQPRDTQGLFTPGSTFKVVTAAAALDTGQVHADSRLPRPRATASSTASRCYNAGNPDQRRTHSGRSPSSQALQHSINSVFCNDRQSRSGPG